MFILKDGILTMDNCDLDHIIYSSENDRYSPLEYLAMKLEEAEIDIWDIHFIKLNESQIVNERYFKSYAKIVFDFYGV